MGSKPTIPSTVQAHTNPSATERQPKNVPAFPANTLPAEDDDNDSIGTLAPTDRAMMEDDLVRELSILYLC